MLLFYVKGFFILFSAIGLIAVGVFWNVYIQPWLVYERIIDASTKVEIPLSDNQKDKDKRKETLKALTRRLEKEKAQVGETEKMVERHEGLLKTDQSEKSEK